MDPTAGRPLISAHLESILRMRGDLFTGLIKYNKDYSRRKKFYFRSAKWSGSKTEV